MFGIILGTLCLVALIGTIRRERYFRRHGYPQHHHGHGCGYDCGGYGYHRHHPGTGAAPVQAPSPDSTPSSGATP